MGAMQDRDDSRLVDSPDLYRYPNAVKTARSYRNGLIGCFVFPPMCSAFMLLTSQDKWSMPLFLWMLVPFAVALYVNEKGAIQRAIAVYPDKIVEIGKDGSQVAEIANEDLDTISAFTYVTNAQIGQRQMYITSKKGNSQIRFFPGLDRYDDLINLVKARIDPNAKNS